MRFGRSPSDWHLQDGDVINKRYMRFGRAADEDDEFDEDKRYMRFGKRYMRFGRDGEDKRYMRFGRSYESSAPSWRAAIQESLRQRDALSSDEGDEISGGEEKRYMRFGRRSGGSLLNDARLSADKRYLRFGRR